MPGMANMDQSGLHERRPAKEQESDSSSKAETEVNFNEEQQQQHKKKTYGRTPDGTGMSHTCCPGTPRVCPCMIPNVTARYIRTPHL